MKRRKFIEDSTLIALSVGVFGKIKWNGQSYVGVDPTTTDILGPFYRPGASFKTGADGKYNFKSIYPVPYAAGPTLIRPAHIHLRISAAGVQDLVTQVYFKGDKHIAGDISAKDPSALNRILDMTKNTKNEKVVKFDVYLKEEYILEATAFKKIEGLYEMSDKSMIEFYKDGDQLFAKINGQIMEAMDYKGDNSFAGAIDYVKAKFELLSGGGAKVKVIIKDDKPIEITGTKLLKYPG